MNQRKFYEECFDLFQFIALFDGQIYGHPIDDRKVVYGEYLRANYSRSDYQKIQTQADRVLALEPFPAKVIADIANRYFADANEVRPWFERMLALLKERVELENK